MSSVLLSKGTADNLTMRTSVFSSKLLLYIGMVMRPWRKNFENFQTFHQKLRGNRCLQFSRFLHGRPSKIGEIVAAQSFSSRCNNHSCCDKSINSPFEIFHCSASHTLFSKSGNPGRHLVICSERVK